VTAVDRGERWTGCALLKISRDSEELRRHEDNHNAIRISLHRTSPTVLASGATVAAALSPFRWQRPTAPPAAVLVT
jgi:MMPL family